MKNDKEITTTELAGMVASGFERVMKEISLTRTELNKKIEDEIRSVKAEISLGLREIKDEIKRLDERVDKQTKTTVLDVNEIVEKVAACELDISKLKQKIAKLKLAN